MPSDSESNSFANFLEVLKKRLWIMEDDEDDVEESPNTITDATRSVT